MKQRRGTSFGQKSKIQQKVDGFPGREQSPLSVFICIHPLKFVLIRVHSWLRCFSTVHILALASAIIISGCKKKPAETTGKPSPDTVKKLPPQSTAVDAFLRVHWLGKQRIAQETNSSYLLNLWSLPESRKLEAHILDRVSLAPARLLSADARPTGTIGTNSWFTNHPSASLLRPLLDDLIESEVYLQITPGTNAPPDFALAVRLDQPRAGLWQADLVRAFAALTNDSRLNLRGSRLEILRSGDWTIAGFGPNASPAVRSLEFRIGMPATMAKGTPAPWLETDVNAAKLKELLGLKLDLPVPLPRVHAMWIGNPQGVSTRAVFDFPVRLPLEFEPWNVPTNLIQDPIHSLMAIRGVRPLLSASKAWQNLNAGPPPNQFFLWGRVPHQSLTYVAAPLTNASTLVSLLADRFIEKGNPWLATNASGSFERTTNPAGVTCSAGAPLMSPFIESATNAGREFVLAGLGRQTEPMPPTTLIDGIFRLTNAVLYEREMTGARLTTWLYLGQALRVVLWKSQLPFDSPFISWLDATQTKLGNLMTVVTPTGPAQLTLDRDSSVGLNSVEIQLLADWVESPAFPYGLHTTLTPGMVRPKPRSGTNTTAAGKP